MHVKAIICKEAVIIPHDKRRKKLLRDMNPQVQGIQEMRLMIVSFRRSHCEYSLRTRFEYEKDYKISFFGMKKKTS